VNNVIIPEIIPDIKDLKSILVKELPPSCKVWVPLLNRKAIGIYKPFALLSEVHLKSNKITVVNTMPLYIGVALLFCLPFAIYLMIKTKDGEALRASVHEIVLRATRKQ